MVSFLDSIGVKVQAYSLLSDAKIKAERLVQLQETMQRILKMVMAFVFHTGAGHSFPAYSSTSKDQYGFFHKPVDVTKIVDYLQFVTKPMDFSTMQKKLDAKEYDSLHSFYVGPAMTFTAKLHIDALRPISTLSFRTPNPTTNQALPITNRQTSFVTSVPS